MLLTFQNPLGIDYCSLPEQGNEDYVGKDREKQIPLFIFS